MKYPRIMEFGHLHPLVGTGLYFFLAFVLMFLSGGAGAVAIPCVVFALNSVTIVEMWYNYTQSPQIYRWAHLVLIGIALIFIGLFGLWISMATITYLNALLMAICMLFIMTPIECLSEDILEVHNEAPEEET